MMDRSTGELRLGRTRSRQYRRGIIFPTIGTRRVLFGFHHPSSGLGLKIDQIDVGRAGFARCLPNGCVAEVVMDDNLLKQLRAGQTATFIIFQTPEEGIGFPLSLKGFGEGYDKLP
jgi:invasion protein IalB